MAKKRKSGKHAGEPAGHIPADNVLACVHVVSNQIGRAFYSEVSAEHDLSLPEWRIILTLAQQPGRTATEITDLWGMEKMAVSRAVRRLESMGRIARQPDADDRRRQVLTLSAKGRRLYEKIEPLATARYHEITDGLSKSDLKALRKTLKKLIARTAALADD